MQAATTITTVEQFLSSVTDSLASFNIDILSKIFVAGFGIAAPLCICWFGYRFIKKRVSKALSKGSL